ncbi:g2375 [Coccomyxa elongata]
MAGCARGDTHSAAEELLNKVHDKDLVKTLGFVNGEWISASDGSTIPVDNPATGDVIANVACLKAGETKSAIAAASAAFPLWSSKTAKERGSILRRWHDLVLAAQDDIATIMTVESGKPFAESKGEFTSGVASIEWFAEECRRVTGDVLQTVHNDRRMIVIKQPEGVVAAITPWNFPMSMITRKIAPALAVGCTVILKPAESTPLTALALAELGHRAGIPNGVLNIVQGDAKAIGDTLLESDTVRKIGFTGSTRVGKMLFSAAADTVKRVSLELGGNAPFIVFDDADIDAAAAGVVSSAFRNAGQTCICANRIFVQDGIYDAFTDAVTEKVKKLKQGPGLDPSITLGPLINTAAVERVQGHVDDAVAKGATVTVGGKKPDLPEPYNKGYFYAPTVLSNATIDMKIFREETFGPAVPLFRFKDDEEAIQLANNTEYGLAAYFFTKDLKRSWQVAERLEYGMVGVNETAITSEVAPFGGIKHSGLGREHSKYGLDEFLYIKYVQMGIGYDNKGF